MCLITWLQLYCLRLRAKKVQVVCNPTNEAEFAPIRQAGAGGVKGGAMDRNVQLAMMAWSVALALVMVIL